MSPAHGLRPTRPGPISEPSQPAVHVAAAAGDDSWPRNAHTLGDLGVGHTIGGQEQDAGPLDEHGWQPHGPCPAASLGQVVRSDRKRGGGRHGPCPTPRHTPNHFSDGALEVSGCPGGIPGNSNS